MLRAESASEISFAKYFCSTSFELPPKQKELTLIRSNFQLFLNCSYWVQLSRGFAFAQRVALRLSELEALIPQFLAYPSCTNNFRAYMGTLILALRAILIV